jgi:hypothetical protein
MAGMEWGDYIELADMEWKYYARTGVAERFPNTLVLLALCRRASAQVHQQVRLSGTEA